MGYLFYPNAGADLRVCPVFEMLKNLAGTGVDNKKSTSDSSNDCQKPSNLLHFFHLITMVVIEMKDIKDLFAIAVKIEENGEMFYRNLADKLKNQDACILFTYLADEEIKHQQTFRELQHQLDLQDTAVAQQAEHFLFLRSYINDIVFSETELKDEIKHVTSAESAIRFGMQRESQTILFYEEVKRLLAVDHHPVIDGVIKEEINHYLKLSELLKGTPA